MKSFYAISGPQPVVPRWSLGNWWSRYYAYSSAEYLELMDKFAAKEIPLSVAVIDMDWHVVNGDEVPHAGWTGYTWNKSLFPDPEAFMRALHDRGLKITLNDHPHAGVHSHEDMYEAMAKVLGHDTTNGAPILFDPTSPEFIHAFLNILHGRLEEQGCDFWWIDWQQGSFSRIPGMDPLWLLNHFQFLHQGQDVARSRPLVFSRYAGPGSHRYPVGFSGDTYTTWASLEFQPEFTASASNIGYGWWSHDIGGHMGGYRDDELTVRWVQFGALSPILRLHSSNSRWMSKEPWRYRHESEMALRDFLQLRHRLVPYIFSTNAESTQCGMPLIQPMYWSFPSLDVAYRFPNQYTFGPTLIVAPIVRQRDRRTNHAQVNVWVPPGRHIDILTGFVYDGDREIDMYRSLRHIPILAPEGSIVPLDKAVLPANGCANPEGFEVIVVVGRDGKFNVLEDTQDDQNPETTKDNQRSIPITYDQALGRLTAIAAGRSWTFRFISLLSTPSPIRVLLDGSLSKESTVRVDAFPNIPSTVVELPTISDAGSTITIEFGSNPQLSIMSYATTMSDILEDSQIDNNIKDQIWNIVSAAQPTATKLGRLLSLRLEEELIGPFVELLVSDSRAEYGGCSSV
jgi:alpha-glucosidase (family GH31 glycosyl hydrolase)